jgi:hypothetical protein
MEVLNEREKTHGLFGDVAKMDQDLKTILYASRNWDRLSDEHKLALEMVCHKMSRILCGNPDEDDHWKDIAGYSELGRRSCNKAAQ